MELEFPSVVIPNGMTLEDYIDNCPTLEDYIADFPYSVCIAFDKFDTTSARKEWLQSLPGGHEEAFAGFGFSYGENARTVYQMGRTQWKYIFKDLNTATEFKLRFG